MAHKLGLYLPQFYHKLTHMLDSYPVGRAYTSLSRLYVTLWFI